MKVDITVYFSVLCVFVLSYLKYVQGKCGPGTYPSRFITGGSVDSRDEACLDCPQNCSIEAAVDVKPCKAYCGELNIYKIGLDIMYIKILCNLFLFINESIKCLACQRVLLLAVL